MRPAPQPGLSAPGASVAAGPAYGPELWPQPDFASATGLTLTHASVSGGQLVFAGTGTGTQRARILSPITLTSGMVIHWELTISSRNANEPVSLNFGGGTGIPADESTGLFAGEFTTNALNQFIDILDGAGDLAATFTHFSVRQKLG